MKITEYHFSNILLFSHQKTTFAIRLGIWFTPRCAIIPRQAMSTLSMGNYAKLLK